jgi:hypothetical protein
VSQLFRADQIQAGFLLGEGQSGFDVGLQLRAVLAFEYGLFSLPCGPGLPLGNRVIPAHDCLRSRMDSRG